MKDFLSKLLIPMSMILIAAGCGDPDDPDENENEPIAENDNEEVAEEEEEAGEEANENNNKQEEAPHVEAELINEEEDEIGNVSFFEAEEGTLVVADIDQIEEGPHGFHIHEEAACDPEDEEGAFMSAGGHYNPDDEEHPHHAGDMPPLFGMSDNSAYMEVKMDAFAPEQLEEDDVAVIVHEDPDNFAHIPERYQSEESEEPGADDESLDTGDAGDRYACGEVNSIDEDED
ncbi:superoxide dismutase family protein [Salsuginibacillus kocurii]|uniref:superoxide dismutase family protein n=1 Tax=Salsuginibacillus kocurii TaxID=427078 RepID=UPI000362E71A|nr:superoxide dismutase family protein [Salsuginibacillus kocurii]